VRGKGGGKHEGDGCKGEVVLGASPWAMVWVGRDGAKDFQSRAEKLLLRR